MAVKITGSADRRNGALILTAPNGSRSQGKAPKPGPMTSLTAGRKGLRRTTAALVAALPIVTLGLSGCVARTNHAGIIGTYVPNSLSAGIPAGTRLLPHYGDITITRPNTVVQNLDVYGFIKVAAANVTIRSTRVHGSGTAHSATGLINVLNSKARNVVISDCDLTGGYASPWIDGVIGHDFTVRRTDIHNVVDGVGVMNPRNKGADLNVNIEGNFIHDLNYIAPDPEQHDGHTHNDGIQIQGTGGTRGKLQVRIFGNNIQAFAGPMSNRHSPYFPAVTGQAIGITPNVSSVHDVVIDSNWLDGGAQSVTIIPGPQKTGSGIRLTNTHFGSRQALVKVSGIRARRPVLIAPGVSVATRGNVYSNGAGIHIWR